MSEHDITANDTGESAKSISLLLSGGGFRATLFHLGVIKCFRDRDKLKLVKQVYSVSGGSILAGHLACNWNDYTGKDDQFDRAANELIRFIKSGVRERVIRMRALFWALCILFFSIVATTTWLIAGFHAQPPLWIWLVAALSTAAVGYIIQPFFKPVYQLELAYRRLFGMNRLSDAPTGSPEFFVLGTNLTTGNLTAFVKSGVIIDLTSDKESHAAVGVQVPLATAVAASSAFPPLFSPWIFDPRKYKLDKKAFPVTKYISDGGVFDNLGIVAENHLSAESCDTVVSDAERRFDWETDQTFRFVVPRTARAFDIAMKRLSVVSYSGNTKPVKTQKNKTRGPAIFLRLQDEREYERSQDFNNWNQTYTFTRQVRTDLDSFLDSEIQCLFFAGYLTATQWIDGKSRLPEGTKINQNGFPVLTDSAKAWLPTKSTSLFESTTAESELSKSHSPKAKLVDWRSPLFWLVILVAMISLAANPISLSLTRQIPVTIGSAIPIKFARGENIDVNLEPHVVALEPLSGELKTENDLRHQHNVRLQVSMNSGGKFYLNRKPFAFLIESRIPDSKILFSRSIVFDRETGFFVFCRSHEQSDEEEVYHCPATSQHHDLIIYVVLATKDSYPSLSEADFNIRMLPTHNNREKSND